MKVMLCGGGTGGHINPALAIADEIKRQRPDAEIAFIGTEKGMENNLVPRAGYPISHVKVLGFRRRLSLRNILAAYRAFSSVWEAKKILREFKPDIVIGTGGYVSWPAVKAASQLGIPTVIHEQNAFPGVATRKLAACANVVCISFRESEKYFKGINHEKIILTGNPIRAQALDRNDLRAKLGIKGDEMSVLSFGGSLGAETVNKSIIEVMRNCTGPGGIHHIHATGRAGYDETLKLAADAGLNKYPNLEICEYLYDMPERETAADVVVCRAGAITIAELAFRRKAVIFIPSPNVAEDHQYKNAKVLSDAGAAIVLRESELGENALENTVRRLLHNPDERKAMEEAIGRFAIADAAKTIVSLAFDACK